MKCSSVFIFSFCFIKLYRILKNLLFTNSESSVSKFIFSAIQNIEICRRIRIFYILERYIFPFFVSFTVVFTSILIFQIGVITLTSSYSLRTQPALFIFFILPKLKDLKLHFHLDHSCSHTHNRHTHYVWYHAFYCPAK